MEPPWWQPVAISRKSDWRENLGNKPKPLPSVATACRKERMVRVLSMRAPSAKEGVTFHAPQREIGSPRTEVLRT